MAIKSEDYRIMEVLNFSHYFIEYVADGSYHRIHTVSIKVKATAEFILNHELVNKGQLYIDYLIHLLDHLFLKNVSGEYGNPPRGIIHDEYIYNKQIAEYISDDLHRLVIHELNHGPLRNPVSAGFKFLK